jgi:hydroxymethylpyrimidine pyrophosphatase-like HAD family hydrolase
MSKTVFVTAEATLIDSNNKIIESTLTRIKQLKKEGYSIVLWSAKGRRYCESVVELHSLKKVIDMCIAKPSLIIDSDDYPLRGSKVETPKYLKREFV